ncbi:MAG TPA: alanine racemase [Jiangellaceae bacterium]|nr:alanine racemase [Jiangellaceae bacterium]
MDTPTPDVAAARAHASGAELRHRLDTATKGYEPPLAVVEMDAWDANAADLVRRATGVPIRVATKSVRCRDLVRDVLARDGYSGVLTLTLPEALWLVATGVTDDAVVGYPTADRGAIYRLVHDAALSSQVTIMVDDPAQLDLVDAVSPPDRRETVRVCVELDCSWRPFGGRVRIGAQRSPLHAPAALAGLARLVADRPGFRLVGVMAYESQVAGVPDAPPGRRAYGWAVRRMQRWSMRELRRRRAAAIAAVRDVADIEFVNAGGTGSVDRSAAEDAVTEVAAGSGLFAPRLFDGYSSFDARAAAFFALPVVRRPGPGVVTVLGGGYVASGAAGADRLPAPWLPAGLRLDTAEGAGEAQTPLLGPPADALAIGDRVWFRHAKAGEMAEHFEFLRLVRGERHVGTATTYRGEGKSFL